ncbi:MAG: pyridoxamine 5'-phosphate oxidase family protein, partial [Planctomycetaceae bacterium]|nr:pyridoxamine 5'-phosphate oxidase family protein [Planctomycetaceae bacterium]
MQPALDFLTANPVTYFATATKEAVPKVRPILFCFEENRILWFCSAKSKNFWKELETNPHVEFT